MVAAVKPEPSVIVLPIFSLPRELKAETREQIDKLRVGAFQAREDVKRIASMPEDTGTAADNAELRQNVATMFEAAAKCLEDTATMLDAIVQMEIYRIDLAEAVPASTVLKSAAAAAEKMKPFAKAR